jgi:hypothetical protein
MSSNLARSVCAGAGFLSGRYLVYNTVVLGVAALEDKIVQQAVATILNQIYEEDFLGFSYGFRPGRSQHDALDALSYALLKKKVTMFLTPTFEAFWIWLHTAPRFMKYSQTGSGDRPPL